MTMNSLDALNPIYHCLDEVIHDYGLCIFVGFIYALIPFSIWAMTGGVRRKLLKGKSVPHIPPVIVLYLPVGSPPPPAETFHRFPPPPLSTNYVIYPLTLDSGDGKSASANYANEGSLGGLAGTFASADSSMNPESGHIAQLESGMGTGSSGLTPFEQWKLNYFGDANASDTGDSDGDGQNNYFEYIAGTIPTNSASKFSFAISDSFAPNQIMLVFSPRLVDRTYTVQFNTDLNIALFSNLQTTTISDVGTTRTVTDTNATANAKFYRVLITFP